MDKYGGVNRTQTFSCGAPGSGDAHLVLLRFVRHRRSVSALAPLSDPPQPETLTTLRAPNRRAAQPVLAPWLACDLSADPPRRHRFYTLRCGGPLLAAAATTTRDSRRSSCVLGTGRYLCKKKKKKKGKLWRWHEFGGDLANWGFLGGCSLYI